jgi:Asp/Glu/hydantoin racemase
MRVKAITPIYVPDEELGRRSARYRKLAPPGVEIDLVNLPDDAAVPRRLETKEDITASDRLVAEVARLQADGADAILPDCVLDPGIDALARQGGPPAFGMLRLAAGFLAACGRRFGAVTRNRAIGEELERRVRLYGLDPWFDRVVVLELDFEAVADHDRWEQALDRSRSAFERTGASAILNGCSAVELTDERETPVLDPTALALRLLGVVAVSGLAAPVAVPGAAER